ncbi:MAG: T9SS type A sorting domain-containing protein [Lewinellaceae bacterium]|nr:T9SS type A sorting domain-containing protein [Lewinellaceae bacterium]
MNSVIARDTMLALGAVNLVVTDVDSTADHGGCVVPALTNTLFFFLGYQQISAVTGTLVQQPKVLQCYPNPVRDVLNLPELEPGDQLQVYDVNSRLKLSKTVSSVAEQLLVTDWAPGVYWLHVQRGEKVWIGKMSKL